MARRRPPRRAPRRYQPTRRPAKKKPTRPTNTGLRFAFILGGIGILSITTTHIGAALLLGLAAFSGYTGVRNSSRRRAAWTARAQRITAYQHMTPTEFERALATLCRRDGCRGIRVVGGAGDMGADVIATTPDGRKIVIQAKRYKPGNPVRSPDVQKVGGTYAVVHGADLAAVVTTSHYTKDAITYARHAGIRLFAERELAAWASHTGPPPWQ